MIYNIVVSSKVSERSKYAWLPLDMIVIVNDSLKILGPIHNLPPVGNTGLYFSILTVFKKIIPGFRNWGLRQMNRSANFR